jgi:hypothetical protein
MVMMLAIFLLFTMLIDVHTLIEGGVNIIYKQHPKVISMDVDGLFRYKHLSLTSSPRLIGCSVGLAGLVAWDGASCAG